MKQLSGNQVRSMFLEYFKENSHMVEESASLIPVNDPSLLWINAGVAALKKYFDGREKPRCNRICNAQKSIRTNDIENVGKTARHHTFFEMLGNFSIGDYFKEEALKFAWGFLTSPEWIGFDPERLYVSVYTNDDEAYRIWTKEIGVDPTHILKTDDNFWQIGEGPCGPDSEIFYDRGEKYDPEKLGEKLFFEEMENDRYIEVWNIVFSQYDAKEGVKREDFKELPQKNIDTGMGLERLVALIQDGETNFDTDLFLPIIHECEKFAKYPYSQNDKKMAYRVIADHIRTLTFALADGANFSNEGRGYVLRRVLRRASRFGRELEIKEAFMYRLVKVVASNMQDFYPYLIEKVNFIENLIKKEEELFLRTLDNGEKLLSSAIQEADDGILKGEIIFKLYDTYGFPKEITMEVAKDHGLKCDLKAYEECMRLQKERSRANRNVEESMHNQSADLLEFDEDFEFVGYDTLTTDAKITGIFKDGKAISEVVDGCDIILDKTSFYAESGGQCPDFGYLENENFKAEVVDVQKAPHHEFMHRIKLIKGTAKVSDTLKTLVDEDKRRHIRANHSSLHLLQSALIKVLGNHINQAGSYVTYNYARFDFTHFEKVTNEELLKVQNLVNKWIDASYEVKAEVLPLIEAKKRQAIALFDEKYGDYVRVVTMGDVSTEFCGGTHVSNTEELGTFVIKSEESIGSGIRRIECTTKISAYEELLGSRLLLDELSAMLKLKSHVALKDRLSALIGDNNALNQKLGVYRQELMNLSAQGAILRPLKREGYDLIIQKLDHSDFSLKDYATLLLNKASKAVVVIFNKGDERLSYVVASDKALDLKANELIKKLNEVTLGKGGGRPDLAQGSTNEVELLEKALDFVKNNF